MIYTAQYASPVGTLTLASNGQGLCGLWLEGQKYFGAGLLDAAQPNDQAAGIPQARAWLDAYFAGAQPEIPLIFAPQNAECVTNKPAPASDAFANKNRGNNLWPYCPTSGELVLAPAGSAFQLAVWEQLLQIPYGHTITYGQIAAALKARGMKAAPIAVGGAVGHNPISIIIPCHRVLGAKGQLTGYAGGLDRKRHLLTLESTSVIQ
jgi:methylated-DNA-[protein]-cysteine S-methyltransferase